jgi:hypothetical protein
LTTALVLYDPGYPRSYTIGVSLARGFKARGWKTRLTRIWTGKVTEDIVAAYGWVWEDAFKAHPHYLYVDLGWWVRRPQPRRISGYHRITYCHRYEMSRSDGSLPGDRLKKLHLDIKPWRPGPVKRVLLAGMSEKSAETSKKTHWDLQTVVALKAFGYQVTYRPKPCRKISGPIDGTFYSDPESESLADALEKVDAVYTHHSNVAVDALVAGIPAYQEIDGGGPFHFLLGSDQIYNEPPDREAYLRTLSYRQWTPDEIQDGKWLDHYDIPGINE